MTLYRKNHYVPEWYQERFLLPTAKERKFYYLDLKPETRESGGRSYKRSELLRWGPSNCFQETDLYTTKFGDWISTEIEETFFGKIDSTARPALDCMADFSHQHTDPSLINVLLPYMSIQKLRTPKGLLSLAALTKQTNKNQIMLTLQKLQRIYCAIWTESVWSIADASKSPIKFIVSDHPVTVYRPKVLSWTAKAPGSNNYLIDLGPF